MPCYLIILSYFLWIFLPYRPFIQFFISIFAIVFFFFNCIFALPLVLLSCYLVVPLFCSFLLLLSPSPCPIIPIELFGLIILLFYYIFFLLYLASCAFVVLFDCPVILLSFCLVFRLISSPISLIKLNIFGFFFFQLYYFPSSYLIILLSYYPVLLLFFDFVVLSPCSLHVLWSSYYLILLLVWFLVRLPCFSIVVLPCCLVVLSHFFKFYYLSSSCAILWIPIFPMSVFNIHI